MESDRDANIGYMSVLLLLVVFLSASPRLLCAHALDALDENWQIVDGTLVWREASIPNTDLAHTFWVVRVHAIFGDFRRGKAAGLELPVLTWTSHPYWLQVLLVDGNPRTLRCATNAHVADSAREMLEALGCLPTIGAHFTTPPPIHIHGPHKET